MTTASDTIDRLRQERGALEGRLAWARHEASTAAYDASTGGPAEGYAAALAEVERIQAEIARLTAAEAGAARAVQLETDDAKAARAAEIAAAANRHATDLISAAERLDDLAAEMVAAWALLTQSVDGHVAALRRGGDARTREMLMTAGQTDGFERRLSAVLARGGLSLPEGREVIRDADLVAGDPDRGQSTVTAVAEDYIAHVRRRARFDPDSPAIVSDRVTRRRTPEAWYGPTFVNNNPESPSGATLYKLAPVAPVEAA